MQETPSRVAGSLYWMHVLATAMLTWVGSHAKRGREAFDAFAILPHLLGTLIHDGWKHYRELLCKHGLCNIHHLRELTYVFEELGQAWAGRMIDLLGAAWHEVNELGGPLPAQRIASFRARYEKLLADGEAVNPLAPKSGRRGRTRQSKAANLLLRLRNYAVDVWRFATDHNVPFTNNIAEQAVRMPKVKQKISGSFRTMNGADTFCTLRSYLATMRKQGSYEKRANRRDGCSLGAQSVQGFARRMIMAGQRSTSVWDAIEDTPQQAARMRARADLMRALQAWIESAGLNQGDAANLLGVTQPRISDLVRGRINLFSLDTLMDMASTAGLSLHVEIKVPKRGKRRAAEAVHA